MKIAFSGCSFTYGDELENPEEQRYSRLVCNKLEAEEINVSRCGMSNDLILHNFLKFCTSTEGAFQTCGKLDVAVIQWTSIARWQLWDDVKNDWAATSPMLEYPKHLTLNSSRYYRNVYTDQHGIENYWKNVYLAEQYCKDNDIKLIMMDMNRKELTVNYVSPYQSLCDSKMPSIQRGIVPFSKSMMPAERQEYWMRNMHPSPRGHQLIAEYLEAQISR